ncbi:uncharacterized protein LOC112563183 [Pomacea canaliculata]|uniref:uncharacterized protein LOC112563183 n=1 Tax=Pomacea canaliculata TaxID=400727 RepID=UPI000D72A8D4|nr:uncharacterized protein LOC112563183 [Pomacea canaliculata]XP_025092754.1 uncharacterized protein LOC112563183 [Pomacea canaliculata]XP_025092755.1 uncharacterized protein LOC112563183 [Pomacea canaliculata]
MGRLQMAVGFSLVVLATICKQTCAVLPHVEQYTPQVVKPLFDQMREYGDKQRESWIQYLVVLIASHDEIMNPKNGNDLRKLYGGRVQLFLNQKDDAVTDRLSLEEQDLAHGEVRFIFNTNNFNNMLKSFRQKHPNENPIIMMYSHYIPCALIEGMKYSCSEEVAVFTTNHWLDFGVMVAFSESYKQTTGEGETNDNEAIRFLRLGGIPTFQYTNSGANLRLVQDTNNESNKMTRWRSVTFLPNFFDCLVKNVHFNCLGNTKEDNKNILAFFVNTAAYECFKNMPFSWRAAKANEIQNSFNDYLSKNIGSDCKQCGRQCGAVKQQAAQECVESSVSNSLVPGEPEKDSNPLDYTWKVSRDEKLSKVFPEKVSSWKNVSCKEKSLTPQSLCTKKGTTPP